jgi:diguanylate cyclase (GGDEF)-like protein
MSKDMLDKLSLRLIDMIEHSNSSNEELKKIKSELEDYKDDNSLDFDITHKKLYTIASTLEKNSEHFLTNLKTNSNEIKAMEQRIKELEAELEQVKEDSKNDFLTKLYNRRALDEQFTLKEAEFKRYNIDYTVVMFDLDHFKAINDTYGHDAGDIVLSAFAKILKKEAREVDIVGRFGGEEFMVILTQTSTDGAKIFANKVRQSVEKTKFIYKDIRIDVTVSAGISQRSNNFNLDSLIKSADNALYEAKKSGRNRVVSK